MLPNLNSFQLVVILSFIFLQIATNSSQQQQLQQQQQVEQPQIEYKPRYNPQYTKQLQNNQQQQQQQDLQQQQQQQQQQQYDNNKNSGLLSQQQLNKQQQSANDNTIFGNSNGPNYNFYDSLSTSSPSSLSFPNRRLLSNNIEYDLSNDNVNYNTFNRRGMGAGASTGPGIGVGRSTSSASSAYAGLFDDDYCPEYWISHQQTCYRFIKSPKRNWHDAKKICKAYNADLVNIDNVDKHSFLLKVLILENLKQNRFWVSARRTGPKNWINDDNSQFLLIDDSFSYDEGYSSENEDLHDNRFLVKHGMGSGSSVDNFNVIQSRQQQQEQPQQQQKQRNQQGINYKLNNNQMDDTSKDRLVYGYSNRNERWMFMPAHDYNMNLFICESKELHDVNNVNLKNDDYRSFDYGMLHLNDMKNVPRGPYFIRQPNDTIFDAIKNNVSLRCIADGYPTPKYHWYKELYVNDTLEFISINPLIDDRYTLSGGNLIIFDPKPENDQGSYHCVAENQYGRIRSETATLSFGFIMEFNLKRSGETGEMNWGKSLFCYPPQHYPDVRYYWSRDYFPNFVEENQRVFVSADGTLYFSYIESVDRANYSCSVKSLFSDTAPNGPYFPLRVIPNSNFQALIFANTFPKVFPEAPIAGQDIRLECVAFGYPIPSYNWTRGNNLPLQRNAYQDNYNRVLIIQNASINDNGEYICTISNPRKSYSKAIVINIQVKPYFTIPLRNKVKDYNSDVQFICEASAIPDVNYTWYKNAERFDVERIDKDRIIIQDNVLAIKYLDPEKDDGMYQCAATNLLKTTFTSAQLRVLSMKPSFKKRPLESEIYAVYNGNTTIVCNPEAAPRPKFQWKKDGNIIGSGGHRTILQTGTLIISPTSRDDAGLYTCVATNPGGSDESKARLIVLQELRFTQTPPPRIVSQIFEMIYLQCEVTYDEVLDVAFIWRHNGEIIRNIEDSDRIRIDRNRLTVHNITLLDGGDYECIVKSSVNQISAKTTVIVEGAPGAPGGVTVISIAKTSALIEWVDGASNGRQIRYYNILGRTNWNRTWTNVSTHVRAHEIERYTRRQQAEVTNLTPWSSYEFSVTAVNDLGIGIPSAPSPLHNTLEDKPYIAPENIGGGGGKIGDLTITWKPLLPQQQNSRGIHYKVFWRLHHKPNENQNGIIANNNLNRANLEWASKVLDKQGNRGIAVVNIPLDNYYTEYDVKVQAINNIGAGPESDIFTIFSAEDMPQVAPQQTVAIGYNSTALNVSWDPIDMAREKIRGKLIGHRLKYWKKEHAEEDAVYYLSRTTRNWALIVGLEPDTYYFVKVMAYNSAGEGPESERYMERTYRKAPQKPPSSVHFFGINPSTVRVVWRYVTFGPDEEPIIGYKVRVWESDQDMITANDTIVLLGGELEAYITNLTPGKSYKMRVLAYSNGGDGRMSSPTLRFQMGKTDARSSAVNLPHGGSEIIALMATMIIVARRWMFHFC